MRPKILLIDNYDSFTYNLVQAFLVLGAVVDVHRNDAITTDEALALKPSHLVISPGPGTPRDAGVSMPMIRAFAGRIPIFGVCLGHQSLVEVFGGKVVRAALMTLLTTPEVAPAMAGALLAALRAKGVTAAEVRGFAVAMRALARKPALPEALDAIDIVGTGGDASGSLNLSTGAALLAAACGLPVVKHGNRSISSRSGSADLI